MSTFRLEEKPGKPCDPHCPVCNYRQKYPGEPQDKQNQLRLMTKYAVKILKHVLNEEHFAVTGIQFEAGHHGTMLLIGGMPGIVTLAPILQGVLGLKLPPASVCLEEEEKREQAERN